MHHTDVTMHDHSPSSLRIPITSIWFKNSRSPKLGPGFIIPSMYGLERIREPVPLKCGKLAAKYPCACADSFYSVPARSTRFMMLVFLLSLLLFLMNWSNVMVTTV